MSKIQCPLDGTGDIDAARTSETSGTQQLTGGIHDDGAGSDNDGSSARHTRRILAAYRKEGAAALAHSSRGRRPANATPKTTADAAVDLAHTRYAGVNHTHLSELLGEREGIEIARSTLHILHFKRPIAFTNSSVSSRVSAQELPELAMDSASRVNIMLS